MAEVEIIVAGRSHMIQCREGEEAHVRRLAERLNVHGETARRASGGLSGERTLLFLALIMADEALEVESNPPEGLPPRLLERIADRLEAVASALEEAVPVS